MRTTQKILALLTAGAFGLSGIANAVTSDTLENLKNNAGPSGGTLTIGDKTFDDFAYVTSGLTGFNPNNIIVTASQIGDNYFLTWGGNIQMVSGGAATADLKLNYTVAASAGVITFIDQTYTGSANPGAGSSAFLAVDENVYNFNNNLVANSHLSNDDLQDPFAERNDDLVIIPGESFLRVTKDIAFGVTGPTGGQVTISEVSQSFHQRDRVPDGGMTVMLLGVALSGLAVIRRKLS